MMKRLRMLAARALAGRRAAPEDGPRSADHRLRLGRADVLIMAGITILYAALAFYNLGDMSGPTTYWRAEKDGERVVFDLGETKDFYLAYNPGFCNTRFSVELSKDGEDWTPPYYAPASNKDVYHWRWFNPENEEGKLLSLQSGDHTYKGVRFSSEDAYYPYQTARYVRLTADRSVLWINELAFLDLNQKPLPILSVQTEGSGAGENNPTRMTDEQNDVPDTPTYMNSCYFDEVYHARTAYEYILGFKPFEWTHPPLGRVIMGLGIRLFGMTPFGWRFMGTLFGALMLPAMYLLLMQLTHRRRVAVIGMLLLSLDGMHFVQTRIATVDSFCVFFIMLSVLFMARYVQTDMRRDGTRAALLPLLFCGINMGLACACKWIGAYCGIGLAAVFFASLFRRARKAKRAGELPAFRREAAITLLSCVLFFVIIPLLIYYFSYFSHMRYAGVLSVQGVWKLQKQMLSYHGGDRGSEHFYVSPWYMWPTIAWPMGFYSASKYAVAGTVSKIVCMGNPIIWWLGLAVVLFQVVRTCFFSRADRPMRAVLAAYFAQLVPWMFVTRGTFIYHYFACVPFMIAALAMTLDCAAARFPKGGRIACRAALLASLAAFAAFYPIYSGLTIPEGYAAALRWFGWRAM